MAEGFINDFGGGQGEVWSMSVPLAPGRNGHLSLSCRYWQCVWALQGGRFSRYL